MMSMFWAYKYKNSSALQAVHIKEFEICMSMYFQITPYHPIYCPLQNNKETVECKWSIMKILDVLGDNDLTIKFHKMLLAFPCVWFVLYGLVDFWSAWFPKELSSLEFSLLWIAKIQNIVHFEQKE